MEYIHALRGRFTGGGGFSASEKMFLLIVAAALVVVAVDIYLTSRKL